MSLNIKNEETHRLIRTLAELTGQTQTSAVEDAVRRRLQELSREDETRRSYERIKEIQERVKRPPIPSGSRRTGMRFSTTRTACPIDHRLIGPHRHTAG